uniref:Uncharacterized protein n=1 Tax=Anguilla anguilla TaxID=7936 RepID=A0A0E9XMB3_ANGAN
MLRTSVHRNVYDNTGHLREVQFKVKTVFPGLPSIQNKSLVVPEAQSHGNVRTKMVVSKRDQT